MAALATAPADILRFALDRAERGIESVIVTLVGIEGSSPRALGAQMAVDAAGDYCGSFSAGCTEAAIVAEARSVLSEGAARLVRFGEGSPYLDIRLPCGGGIDLLFSPRPDPGALRSLLRALGERTPASVAIGHAGIRAGGILAETGWRGDAFHLAYAPPLRIVALGHGETLVAMARLARFYGTELCAFSTDEADLAALARDGIEAHLLVSRTRRPNVPSDGWTAFAFLFHDHDWEESLLPWALGLPHLYLGAIGGRRSRADRRAMLRGLGVSDAQLAGLRSPAGLIPSTRDPAALALSILSEIVGEYQRRASVIVRPERASDVASLA